MTAPYYSIGDIVYRGMLVDSAAGNKRPPPCTIVKINGESVRPDYWVYEYHVRTENNEVHSYLETELRSAKEVELVLKLLNEQEEELEEELLTKNKQLAKKVQQMKQTHNASAITETFRRIKDEFQI